MRTERVRVANLTLLLIGLAGLTSLLSGAALWLGFLIVGAAAAFGAFQLLGDVDPRGVPIESLTTPVVAAMATAGLAHLSGANAAMVLVLAGGGLLLAATLVLETWLMGPADEMHARRERQLAPLVVLLAFLGFAGAAASVVAGLAVPQHPGLGQTAAIDAGSMLLLAVADGAVAFLLGYRLAATRAPDLIEAAWAAGTFAVVVGVAATLLRALALPLLLGPAVLAGVFYLWSAYRAAPGGERRSASWLWEYLVLLAALVGAVAWNLLLR
ncbi:MAG: hypothetical protein ACHQ15_00815 [Candidatus Limnocylindrales bacterium]